MTVPEPPDGTRIEFEYGTDVYAAWRDDATSAHDPVLSDIDRTVLDTIARWPHIHDPDDCAEAGDLTLNALCATLHRLPRPHVFAAVARLEDRRYLPVGAIR